MKALDPLAVADRDILALRTARENSARSDDYTSASAPRPFSPPGTAPHRDRGQPRASPTDCDARACASHPSHDSVARMKARDSARHRNRTATASQRQRTV